jgi:farnesyl-diphosphate farnesyltransferase
MNTQTRVLFALAKPVSRSFYLTIRFLPEAMRQPVCLAYLLARLSDSIADSAAVPGRERLELLESLCNNPRAWVPERLLQKLPTEEAVLAARLPFLLDALDACPDADLIRDVLDSIHRGQLEDVRRAAEGTEATPLEWERLLEYTNLVAGCVGEFWTRLAMRRCPRVFKNPPGADTLRSARRYGVTLQLVNILRDSARDAAKGRAYLHSCERSLALTEVRAGLRAAADYLKNLRSGRFYVATALPAQIAALMLPSLERLPNGAEKIRRSSIFGLIVLAVLRRGPLFYLKG